ncbi:MAG: hypothetical protein PHF89_04375 [Eubacteriales bacterium]|jgi:hypothetical protein|nr:hypothetical protein [Eubacteriales bacterium]
MKRVVTVSLAFLITLTMTANVVLADPQIDGEIGYFYENFTPFSTIDGTRIGDSNYNFAKSSTYYVSPYYYPNYNRLDYNFNGYMGTTGDRYFSTYPSSLSRSSNPYTFANAHIRGAKELKALDVGWFDETNSFDGILVASMDIKVPSKGAYHNGSFVAPRINPYLSHIYGVTEGTLTANGGYVSHIANGMFACLPAISINEEGQVIAYRHASTSSGNKPYNSPNAQTILGAEPGDWVQIAAVIKRNPVTKKYTVRSYVNGVALGDAATIDPTARGYADADTIIPGDNGTAYIEAMNDTEKTKSGDNNSGGKTKAEILDAYKGIGFLISLAQHEVWDEFDESLDSMFGVDNLNLRVYDKTTLPKMVFADGQNALIPVINTAMENASVDAVKKGIIDMSNASISAKKYSADDSFLLNESENVSESCSINSNKTARIVNVVERDPGGDAAIGNYIKKQYKLVKNGTVQVTAEEPITPNGTSISLNVPPLAQGERLMVTVEGAIDINDSELANNTVIIQNSANNNPVTATVFTKNGEPVAKKYNADKITVNATGSFGMLYLKEGTTVLKSAAYNAAIGGYVINLDSGNLKPGHEYQLTNEDGLSSVFTVETGELEISNFTVNTSGTASFDYANLGDTDASYVLIIAAYDANNALIGVKFNESDVLISGDADTITDTLTDVNGTVEYYKAFIWDADTLKPLIKNADSRQ